MPLVKLNNIKIGYIPYSPSLEAPGDRRRFIFFAKRTNLNYEIYDSTKKYDLVVANSLTDPDLLLNLPRDTKLIFDFADAYMAENLFSIRGIFRGLIRYSKGKSSKFYFNYKNAFLDLMKRSEVVICSSPEQKKLITPFCKKVKVILDSHIDECNKVKKNFKLGNTINIAWEGQHATLPSLLFLAKKISKTYLSPHVNFHIVTDDPTHNLDKLIYGNSIKKYLSKKKYNISFYPWSIENMNNLAEKCDIAIIPVNLKNPMHALKPENRLNLFWRLGLPVLATSTEANIRAMKNCNHDLFFESPYEFFKKIELLRNCPDLIKKYSQTALNYIHSKLTTQYYIDLWHKTLMDSLD
ncbi:MAG: hypothetical protein VX590_03970 [Chloroflexota bacterium]|nr:hypothetical protein [Chloroflexota bacterium]